MNAPNTTPIIAAIIPANWDRLRNAAKAAGITVLDQWTTPDRWIAGDAEQRVRAVRIASSADASIFVGVTDERQALAAAAAGATHLVACGAESPGAASTEHGLVLLQKLRRTTDLPILLRGGIGPDGAAAAIAAGAAGIVLDAQLWLAEEAPQGAHQKAIRAFNPADTRCHGVGFRFRVFAQLATRASRELLARETDAADATSATAAWSPTQSLAHIQALVAADPATADWRKQLIPVGQCAAFAARLADRHQTVAGIAGAYRTAIQAATKAATATDSSVWAAGTGISTVNGTALPIHQGPMAQVADTPAFAAAVAQAGAMPWLALGNMPTEIAAQLIERTRAACGDLPFGAGIIGLDANPFRDGHIELLKSANVPFALVAAGTSEQALDLERCGVRTYLHTPTPGILRDAVQAGLRRFILEGGEAGGHVGGLGGLVLWQLAIWEILDAIEAGAPASSFAIVPAGGIGTPASALALGAMMAPLRERGVALGLQVGSAYLMTAEAVSTGAVSATYQRDDIRTASTRLMGEAVGAPTRVLDTPCARRIMQAESDRARGGTKLRDRKEAYEHDNLGGLRAAAKAQRFVGGATPFADITLDDQLESGLFHAGQAMALQPENLTIAQLHADLTTPTERAKNPIGIATSVIPATAPALERIAIVGMGAVLPDAPNVARFWENLQQGVCSIRPVPDSRWRPALHWDEDRTAVDRTYSKIGAFVSEFSFDRKRFRVPPNVVQSIDRSHQLALSATAEALDSAGVLDDPNWDRTRCGVFVGNSNGGDLRNETTLRAHVPEMVDAIQFAAGSVGISAEQLGALTAGFENRFLDGRAPITEDSMPGELPNCIAGRIAGAFDIGGPNWVVDAACASSLAAMHVAVDQLRRGDIDSAIVGGTDAQMGVEPFVKFSKIGALSHDGSRPFDVSANGFVMGEGAALFLVMRESDARAQGRTIYATVRGVGASSDGKGKGITAPNPAGQQRALERAYADAKLDPKSVTMFEAHGTSTPVGDPVEVGSLTKFVEYATEPTSLGSVKSNIGHLKAAAGAAGLLKTILCLHHATLVPSIGVTTVNPKLNLDGTNITVQRDCTPWTTTKVPRRAGVSAFGFGGTNVHIVLEQGELDPRHVTTVTASSVTAVAPTNLAVPMAAAPMAAAPSVIATKSATSRDAVESTVVRILCERTGYDASEIEADFELEADLGVDTVKQAEIMAEVRTAYALAKDDTFRLGDYPTITALTDYVVARAAGPIAAEAAVAAAPLVQVSAPSPSATVPTVVSNGATDRATVESTIVRILCERTGYDASEIEADFELEADLGVDTVKQAEIMAEVRTEYALAKDDSFRLGDHATIAALTDYVVARAATSPVASSAMTPSAEITSLDTAAVESTIVRILCERTGYDASEIEVDFELEADLGVDTVKQAEIMAEVRTAYALAKDDAFRLGEYPTIKALTAYVTTRAAGSVAPSAPAGAPTAVIANAEPPAPTTAAVSRSGVSPSAVAMDRGSIETTIVRILCERTGYDTSEIEVDFELEADLGVDTVKQAEIMAEVRTAYGLAKDDSFRLGDYPTIKALTDYVANRSVSSATVASVVAPATAQVSATAVTAEQAIPSAVASISKNVAPSASSSTAVTSAGAPATFGLPDGVICVAAESKDALLAALRGVTSDTGSTGAGAYRVAICFDPAEGLAADLIDRVTGAIETGKGLRLLSNRGVHVNLGDANVGRVAFLYPGQGTQYIGMLSELRRAFPIVQQTLDEADEVMTPLLGKPLSAFIEPAADEDEMAAFAALTRTEVTQPAVLTADIALMRLFARYGFKADAVIGHSLGEYAACVGACVLDFPTALRTVSTRGTAMANVQPMDGDVGWMAAVPAGAEQVEAVLATVDGYVVCANKNCASQTIIAGSTTAVQGAMKKLEALGLQCMQLPVSHAFHTRVVADAEGPLRAHLAQCDVRRADIPIVSNVTGNYYPEAPADIVDLLAQQVASPVEFIAGIETMYADGVRTFVEVGPKRAQTAFVGSILEGREHAAVHTCHPKQGELVSFRNAVALLAARHGVPSRATATAALPAFVAEAREQRSQLSAASTASNWNVAPNDTQDTQWPVPAQIVCSGTSVGLPGLPNVFDENAIEAIFAGQNLIDRLPAETVEAMLQKHITRLHKSADGTADFVPVRTEDECIKLGGQGGAFTLEEWGVDKRIIKALDQASKLAFAAGLEALRDAHIPLVPTYRETRSGAKVTTGWALPESMRDTTGVLFASSFSGRDVLAQAAKQAAIDPDYVLDNRILLQILGMAHSRFAEWIGARGPNSKVNVACASVTQAVGVAEDWIKVGRCKRVVIIGADDVTHSSLMEWIGAGFLASGAATVEGDVSKAALPFDERRNGTILGMGAVGMVVEEASLAAERGVVPVADILSTCFLNSGFHPTRLDVDHISTSMKSMVGAAEQTYAFNASDVAAETVFISHETFTPARGGSAAAEIEGIRAVFGDKYQDVLIANTKGFTGHPMGAGSEDVVGMQILQRQVSPPIANYRDRDPSLGSLRLSAGGAVAANYALRFSAGFGSQLAFALYRRRARTQDRLIAPQFALWMQKNLPANTVLRVEDRTLRACKPTLTKAAPINEAAKASVQAPVASVVPTRPAAAAPAMIAKQVPVASPQAVAVATQAAGQAAAPSDVRTHNERFVLRQVGVCAAAMPPHNAVLAADALGNRDVVLVGGPAFIDDQLARAFERVGARVTRIIAQGERTLFHETDVHAAELTDEESLAAVFVHSGPNPIVVNLCGYVDDQGDPDVALAAARQSFHIARAYVRHLGRTPGAGDVFCSLVSLGGRLGFERVPKAVLGAGAVCGLTKSLAREWPEARVQVVDVPFSYDPSAAHHVVAAVVAENPSIEVGIRGGSAYRPCYQEVAPSVSAVPDANDVWLVSGGARGITAEIVVAVATAFKGSYWLTGRTPLKYASASEIDVKAEKKRITAALKAEGKRVTPVAVQSQLSRIESELEIHTNLSRLRALGVRAEYVAGDVTDAASTHAMVAAIAASKTGAVTRLIHGAGLEVSRALVDKDPAVFDRVFKTKVHGAVNLLNAAGAGVKTFIGFSSVAGRFGNAGQADYSAANDALSKLAVRLTEKGMQALSIDWTAWAGVGMATRGSLKTILESRGVELLPPDRGAQMVVELLTLGATGEVLATGALGAFAAEVPDLRQERVVTPTGNHSTIKQGIFDSIEVDGPERRSAVATTVLDPKRTDFLNEHRIDGVAVLPGVMGMELFAEVARQLVPTQSVTGVLNVQFERPVRFHRDTPLRIRVEAERTDSGVQCVLSSERKLATGRLKSDVHFRGLVGFDAMETNTVAPLEGVVASGPKQEAIYGAFFHTGSFRVMDEVRYVTQAGLVAACTRHANPTGYGRMVTDPLVREMALQAAGVHVMMHDGRVALPHRVGSCSVYGIAADDEALIVRLARRKGTLVFDADILTEEGVVLQSLRDFELIDVGPVDASSLQPTACELLTRELSSSAARRIVSSLGVPLDVLFGPEEVAALHRLRSKERRDEWLAARLALKLLVADVSRDLNGAALSWADIRVHKDPAGAPHLVFAHDDASQGLRLAATDLPISLSHSGGLGLAAVGLPAGPQRVGVDIEHVAPRSKAFANDNLTAGERALDVPGISDGDTRVTAMWAMKEAVMKVLGLGMALRPDEIEVTQVNAAGDAIVSLHGRALDQHRALGGGAIRVRMSRRGNRVHTSATLSPGTVVVSKIGNKSVTPTTPHVAAPDDMKLDGGTAIPVATSGVKEPTAAEVATVHIPGRTAHVVREVKLSDDEAIDIAAACAALQARGLLNIKEGK